MAEFLTTRGISHHIEDVIIKCKTKLVLVSPFLKLSQPFYQRLKDADTRGVKITIVYGKKELKSEEQDKLAELKNLHVFYFEHLHAKCYFNEAKMVITSMNMYEFSEIKNREMGVLIDRKTDKRLFEEAMEETRSIIHSADPNTLHQFKRSIPQHKIGKGRSDNISSHHGYCIRCEASLTYNPNRPYCPDCYEIWTEYENQNYLENVCHRCGSDEDSSMNKPLCRQCYSEYQKQLSKY